MRDRILRKLPRMLLSLLLSVGLWLPLLGALRLSYSLAECLLITLLGTLVLEALTFSRRPALYGSVCLAGLFLVWLFSAGGALVSDLLRAFSLHVSGIHGALPLMAEEASAAIALLLTFLSFLSSRRFAGGVSALMLVLAALLMLWLADRADLLLHLLPAGIAALTLLLMERHEELSFFRVFPWVAALVLLSFVLTPASGLLVPAWKERADSFRQAVLDRLFFTEPRDVFSLASEGYYPQGISQLGGPVTPSNHPVMQVSTPRTAYLRGVLMNEYDGRAWRNTLGGRRCLWDAGSMAALRAQLFDQLLPAEELASALTAPADLSIRMLKDSASTLFVPQRVRALRPGGELVAYFSNSSELFATRNLQPGDTWAVSAPLPLAGDAGLGTLIEAAAAAEDPQWESIRETYTTLPAHLEEPVWQLATDLTEKLDSPYEKALALQNYLSRNYRYRLDVDYQPENIDFVTNFLFNTREGYCTYFASALTVLCRMAGIPARYVEGYLAEPDQHGEALVTGLNAHAWTEVYLKGFGWLTFDATPRQGRGGSSGPEGSSDPDSSSEETPAPTPETESASSAPEEDTPTPPPEEEPTSSPIPEEQDPTPPAPGPSPEAPEPPAEEAAPGASGGFPWLVLPPLLLLLAALLLLLRWLRTAPEQKEKRLPEEADKFDLWLNDVLLRLSSAGYLRRSGETLMTFTRRLDAEAGLPVSLSRLGECASLLHYGKVQALPTDTDLARRTAQELKRSLPRQARWKYAGRRLFRKAPTLAAS